LKKVRQTQNYFFFQNFFDRISLIEFLLFNFYIIKYIIFHQHIYSSVSSFAAAAALSSRLAC